MRVLLDTSILIGYLGSRSPETSAAFALFGAAQRGALTLLLVEGVINELNRKLRERPDLAARIPRADANQLIDALRSMSEPVASLTEPYPEVGRDRDDDFLIAHAVFADADWLVTWDKDLLDLGQIDGLTVADPPRFLAELRDAGLL